MELTSTGNLQIDGTLELDGNKILNSTGNDTITMATGATGLVTLSGNLQVTGNQIKNSSGTSVITFDTNELDLIGDLQIRGNKIRNDSGNDTITMATGATGLVTLAGDLQVTGNEIKNNLGTSVITFDINSEVEFTDAIQIKGNLIRNSTGNDTITMGTGATGLVTLSGNLQVGGNEIKSSGGTTAITLNGANISSTGHATFANIDIGTSVAGQIDTNGGLDLTLDSDGGDVIVNDRLTVNVTLQTPSEDTVTSGAMSIGTSITEFETGASGQTSTLGAANVGQFKSLYRSTSGAGAMVVTVTSAGWKGGASGTITFGNQGDSCLLQYMSDGRWYILGSYDVVIA
jgi:hypothetical protein